MVRERWDLPSRITNATAGGGKTRFVMRLIVSISVLVILGMGKLICNFNHISAQGGFGEGFISVFFKAVGMISNAMWYAYLKISLLLGDTIFDMSSVGTDMFVVLFFGALLYLGIYPLVSIILDVFDGSPEDKAPILHKLIITLAVMILTMLSVQMLYGENSDDWMMKTNFILNPEERAVCKLTGDLPMYVPNIYQNVSVIEERLGIGLDSIAGFNLTSTDNISVGEVIIENK